MSVLIDTHILLWFINDDPKLNQKAKALLQSDIDVSVSIASLWEIAIKVSIGNGRPRLRKFKRQKNLKLEIVKVKDEMLLIRS